MTMITVKITVSKATRRTWNRVPAEPWAAVVVVPAEGAEGGRVADAGDMEDEVIAALNPEDPEEPEPPVLEVEFCKVLEELPLPEEDPVPVGKTLDVGDPDARSGEEVAGKPLEDVTRREAEICKEKEVILPDEDADDAAVVGVEVLGFAPNPFFSQ